MGSWCRLKTVQSYSEALKRRELEGAPILRERGEDLVLAERFLWPYVVLGAGFIVLGSAMSVAWIAMLAFGTRRPNDWLLIVIGFAALSLGLLIIARAELCFSRAARQFERKTFLFGVPVRSRRIRFDQAADRLVLELSWGSHRGRSFPVWSLQIPRPTSTDTLLTGYCTHAAAEEVFQISAESTGLQIEIKRR